MFISHVKSTSTTTESLQGTGEPWESAGQGRGESGEQRQGWLGQRGRGAQFPVKLVGRRTGDAKEALGSDQLHP